MDRSQGDLVLAHARSLYALQLLHKLLVLVLLSELVNGQHTLLPRVVTHVIIMIVRIHATFKTDKCGRDFLLGCVWVVVLPIREVVLLDVNGLRPLVLVGVSLPDCRILILCTFLPTTERLALKHHIDLLFEIVDV